jgi:hypothetical protein
VLEYVPDAQFVQTRSADVVPAAEAYVPGWHVDHAPHEAAFVLVLNCPLVHVEQTRSDFVVGAAETNCPAVHE